MTIEQATARQIEQHRKAAQEFAVRFREYNQANDDWSYHPPTNDDPETWGGVTKWCALEVSYTFHCRRQGDLERGMWPAYCPEHDEAREGFRPAPCFRCSWDMVLYDRAIANARRMGKDWMANVAAGREMARAS